MPDPNEVTKTDPEPAPALPNLCDGISSQDLAKALIARKNADSVLKELTDDELLKELAARNCAVVYSAVRAVSEQGLPLMPTIMVHGREMHVHAVLSRLVMYIQTGQTLGGGKHA